MLDHSSRDLLITKTKSFVYKVPSKKIKIINKHTMSFQGIPLPTNRIKPCGEYLQTGEKINQRFK